MKPPALIALRSSDLSVNGYRPVSSGWRGIFVCRRVLAEGFQRVIGPAHDRFLAIGLNEAPYKTGAAFARQTTARVRFGRQSQSRNVMLSGHGRLILRDGTDLPIGYRLVYNEFGSWCSGTLIGDVRSVDPGSFGEGVDVELDGGRYRLVALITGYSERHLCFVAKFEGADAEERLVAAPG